jgi:hypothetical protein
MNVPLRKPVMIGATAGANVSDEDRLPVIASTLSPLPVAAAAIASSREPL